MTITEQQVRTRARQIIAINKAVAEEVAKAHGGNTNPAMAGMITKMIMDEEAAKK